MCNPEVQRIRCWGSFFSKLVFQQPVRLASVQILRRPEVYGADCNAGRVEARDAAGF